jgi:hypothetical protein
VNSIAHGGGSEFARLVMQQKVQEARARRCLRVLPPSPPHSCPSLIHSLRGSCMYIHSPPQVLPHHAEWFIFNQSPPYFCGWLSAFYFFRPPPVIFPHFLNYLLLQTCVSSDKPLFIFFFSSSYFPSFVPSFLPLH